MMYTGKEAAWRLEATRLVALFLAQHCPATVMVSATSDGVPLILVSPHDDTLVKRWQEQTAYPQDVLNHLGSLAPETSTQASLNLLGVVDFTAPNGLIAWQQLVEKIIAENRTPEHRQAFFRHEACICLITLVPANWRDITETLPRPCQFMSTIDWPVLAASAVPMPAT